MQQGNTMAIVGLGQSVGAKDIFNLNMLSLRCLSDIKRRCWISIWRNTYGVQKRGLDWRYKFDSHGHLHGF